MTLHKMHKRGEAGRRGEVAVRYAAAHPLEAIAARAEKPDAKVEPTMTVPKVVPTVTKPVVTTAPVVKPTVTAKTTAPIVKPTVTPTSASVEASKSVPASSSAASVTSASVPTTSAPPSTTVPTTTSTPPVVSTPTSKPVTPTSVTPIVSLPTSNSASASAAGVSASTSTVPQPSTGLGVGSIIGIIAGVFGGLLVIGLIVSFFLRRLRTRSKDAFNSNTFRRSAIMLKDDEKEEKGPRPPSMFAHRHAAPVPGSNARANVPTPPMSYPYSDSASTAPSVPTSLYGQEHAHHYPQFGSGAGRYAPSPAPSADPYAYAALPGAYGIPPPMAQYGGAHYEQAGFGAPPVPGTYGPGAYAAYGQDPRYQQYPHHQHQGYPQQQHGQPRHHPQAPQHHQQAVTYGNPATDLTRSESLATSAALPNPFGRSPTSSPPSVSASLAPAPISEKQRLREAELQAEASAASSSGSSSSASGSSSSLARRPTQTGGAPPAYVDDGNSASWAARRDQKRANEIVMSVTNASSSSSEFNKTVPTVKETPAATPRTTQVSPGARPVSEFTLYGDDTDAYGGM